MSTVSWTLSGFGDEIDPDPVVQAAVLQALGASHIEVRSAWGVNIVDLSAERLDRLDRLAGVLAERGMGVSAIASPIGKVDVALPVEHEVERLGRAIAAAKRLDARFVRLFSFFRAEGVAARSVRDDVHRPDARPRRCGRSGGGRLAARATRRTSTATLRSAASTSWSPSRPPR